MAIIVYGEKACGKTRNSEKIRKHFGKKAVMDYDDAISQRRPINNDTVYLTADSHWLTKTTTHRVVKFEDIKAKL